MTPMALDKNLDDQSRSFNHVHLADEREQRAVGPLYVLTVAYLGRDRGGQGGGGGGSCWALDLEFG